MFPRERSLTSRKCQKFLRKIYRSTKNKEEFGELVGNMAYFEIRIGYIPTSLCFKSGLLFGNLQGGGGGTVSTHHNPSGPNKCWAPPVSQFPCFPHWLLRGDSRSSFAQRNGASRQQWWRCLDDILKQFHDTAAQRNPTQADEWIMLIWTHQMVEHPFYLNPAASCWLLSLSIITTSMSP